MGRVDCIYIVCVRDLAGPSRLMEDQYLMSLSP
jgi:hypothetical protein